MKSALIKRWISKPGIQRLIKRRDVKGTKVNVDYNIMRLQQFCEDLNQHGIQVLIADSQYHPRAYNYKGKETVKPNSIVRNFCKENKGVQHIPLARYDTTGFYRLY